MTVIALADLRRTKMKLTYFPSEFLLGDKVLVAPILDEGANTRDIYLPRGTWRDEVDPNHEEHEGPKWLRGYAADLFTLPYFTKL